MTSEQTRNYTQASMEPILEISSVESLTLRDWIAQKLSGDDLSNMCFIADSYVI